MPPFAERDGQQKAAGFMAYNRNKKSLALDLRHPDGQAVFRDLAAKSDVVVENLRPGALTKLGLDYDALKTPCPELVWASISGFGRLDGYRGPYSDRPAFDIVAEAMSGIMHMVGFCRQAAILDDLWHGRHLYRSGNRLWRHAGVVHCANAPGPANWWIRAMLDNMLSLNESMIALHSVAGQSPSRGKLRNAYPRGAYQTKDGYIALNVPDDRIWQRLAELIGRRRSD